MNVPSDAAGSLALVGSVSPFAAAIALALISPLLNAKVKRIVMGQIAADSERHGVGSDAPVPPHLGPDEIGDYVEYAADAVQVLPLTLLPAIGAVFAISKNQASVLSLVFIGVIMITAVTLDAWVLSRSTADYVSIKFGQYSVIALASLAINVAGILLVMM